MNGRGGGVRGLVRRLRGRDIELKSPGEIEAMRAAGAVVAAALAAVAEQARPGVSTAELDAVAEQVIRAAGAIPSFLGYPGEAGPFPGSICASVNEEIVHGIPSADRLLAEGDLISVDCGAILEGWHGDAAVTLPIGTVAAADLALSAACREALEVGIAAARPGAHLTDISHAIEHACLDAARRDQVEYGIVEEYGGHGIGTSMHMDPYLPNHGAPGAGPRLVEGMALAIEPMLTAGSPETRELDDGWTVVTAAGGRAVHWEHSVAITADGPRILTLPA